MDERRNNKKEVTALYALAFAVLVQGAAGVWWAATVSTDVKHASATLAELKQRISFLEQRR